ncbi:MAG: ketoacyl-ACP synthase III [Chthoniobacteraceae bacterium]|nr:ketoacyl-ACP synthase III [Chthoniobacteraceae bacterium]
MNKPQPRTTRLHKPKRTVSIIGTGSYVPEKVLTNAALEKLVDTSDEWIVSRTGIKERRVAAPEESTSDLASKAARAAIEKAGISAEEIDMIIIGTVTPDMAFPNTACLVQKQIGAKNAICFDLSAACSGFLFGLEIAQQFISSRTCDTILVIGADKLSGIVNWQDRNTCVLFGDGAGAAILQHRPGSHGIIHTTMGANGDYAEILHMPGGGSRMPLTKENIEQRPNTIHMNGKDVYKQAVTAMVNAAHEALETAGLQTKDLACVIPHQANLRIIEAIGSRLGLGPERVFCNLQHYGNTSAAAVAIALDEAARAGRMKRDDYILLVVFGGGLTWACSVIQW